MTEVFLPASLLHVRHSSSLVWFQPSPLTMNLPDGLDFWMNLAMVSMLNTWALAREASALLAMLSLREQLPSLLPNTYNIQQ